MRDGSQCRTRLHRNVPIKIMNLKKSFWCDFYCGESLSMRLTIIWCFALTPQGLHPPRWNVKKHYSDCLHEVRLRPPASLVFDIKSTALFTAIKFAMSQTGKALGWLHFRCWRMFHARSHAGFYYQQSHQLITFFLSTSPHVFFAILLHSQESTTAWMTSS